MGGGERARLPDARASGDRRGGGFGFSVWSRIHRSTSATPSRLSRGARRPVSDASVPHAGPDEDHCDPPGYTRRSGPPGCCPRRRGLKERTRIMSIARRAWLVSVLVVLPVPRLAPGQDAEQTPEGGPQRGGRGPPAVEADRRRSSAGFPGRHSMPRIATARKRSSRGFPSSRCSRRPESSSGRTSAVRRWRITSSSRRLTATGPCSRCPNWTPTLPITSSCWPIGGTESRSARTKGLSGSSSWARSVTTRWVRQVVALKVGRD